MKVHVLEREQLIAKPRGEVFAFFADAYNLEALTPPWLRFAIRTRRPIEMRKGAMIAYRMRLHGLPVRWLTEIEEWEPQVRFVDRQIKGPYSLWHHTHTFEDREGATLMRDRVRYALPLGPLGELARLALVDSDLRRIFDFRREVVARLLG
ncbi:MAG TPA: SRPBCC family protein [Solirubrobacteraceae bacterium]|nr:SRPBCC family protein [Solirubrobacteraceae bacterium]